MSPKGTREPSPCPTVTDDAGTTSYVYDSASQLTRENNQAGNFTHVWKYDNAGNILSRTEYAYTTGELGTPTDTILYGYRTEGWRDVLTSYDGQTIVSDEIGNITDDGNRTYTWKNGRELDTVTDDCTTWSMTYNADGIRVKRTNGTTIYSYVYDGGTLLRMKKGSEHMMFAHSPDGTPLSIVYDDLLYYYVTNLQGDVVAILDAAGAEVVTYTYDAWGNILTIDGSKATTLGQDNPLRYRGYVYDTETDLYYVSSRYYDPEIGRWINADGELSEIGGDLRGYNLFAYCFNNPANMDDPTGDWPKWLSGALNVVGGALQVAAGAALGATVGWTGFGAVAAGFLIVNGTATAAQGVGQIVNHVTNSNVMREDNIVRTGAQEVGRAIGGDTGAKIAGSAYDMAVFAASIYAGRTINSPSACFVAGTIILTAVGEKTIEEIGVGELVWSRNTHTGEISLKKVVQTFACESKELVYVHVNSETIVTTPEHPFYVSEQGWIKALKLRAGDVLVLQNGGYAVVEGLQHEILKTPITVYNFEVADFHTYYVGKNNVLVHNTCQRFTANQQAVIDLARESRKGLSRSEAEILVEWAQEYGINSHGPMVHPNRSGIWGIVEHIKIFKEHIPIIE